MCNAPRRTYARRWRIRHKLKEAEEGSQISEWRGKSDVGDAGMENKMKVDVHVDSDRANGPERK